MLSLFEVSRIVTEPCISRRRYIPVSPLARDTNESADCDNRQSGKMILVH